MFCYDTVIIPLLFGCSATLAAVYPLTTTCNNWYSLTDTPMIRLPLICVLPTSPEALGEVATMIGDSATIFYKIQGDAAAQSACLYLQLAEDRFGFEIMVYRVYVDLWFLSFLR
jgi:hypothetical protein